MPRPENRYRDRSAAKSIGSRIDSRARELKLKHTEVALRAGLNYKTYMGYRRGTHTPDPTTLATIAVVLETTMEALTTGETAWPVGDPRAKKALHEIQLAASQLSGDELEMIADMALTARSRRWERNGTLHHRSPALDIQARVHERFLPVVIRHYAPVAVLTACEPTSGGAGSLRLELRFKLYADLEKIKIAMADLIKNQLQLPERDVDIRIDFGKPNARFPERPELPRLLLAFRLKGTKAKTANAPISEP